ncbi:DUF2268 domain-containing putative Zn-dependent protease [Marinoscillum sp.]|uniref:gliding motility protein GldB-related protein n=1 Tax=Marinoscillum sp. TaxID=2024838 RepID=UPI003BAC8574
MNTLRAIIGFGFLVILVACGDEEQVVAPKEPKFFTSDIELFWEVYEASDDLSATNFQQLYIDRGTKGLKDYAQQKDLAPTLKTNLSKESYTLYYDAVKKNTLDMSLTISVSRHAFLDLAEIYPSTTFHNVYFLIGGMTAGGRVSDSGLLIAVEMFAKDDQTPTEGLGVWLQSVTREKEYLPSVVVHEFVHMQQRFTSTNSEYVTTLEQSIREGMADFVSYYMLGDQPFMNEHLHTYGNEIEEELWKEFELEMNANFRSTEWLYSGGNTSEGHPADMGYYVGFKILEAYSATFPSVEDAIHAMLENKNYVEIFERSKYGEQFD